MGLNVVLYQPEIPANTGNIARTCAATNTVLHLIRPLGFSTDDKMLKRAGLDYWKFEKYGVGEYYYLTKFGEYRYTDFDVSGTNKNYYFVFGRETSGLPEEVIEKNRDRCLRIPMSDCVRALNLSNTAAIIVYEALRQQGFPGVK